MSFLLDALRKSEAQRRRGRTPDLQQQVTETPLEAEPSGRNALWLGLLAVLLLIIVALAAWLWTLQRGEVASQSTEDTAATAAPPPPVNRSAGDPLREASTPPLADEVTERAGPSTPLDRFIAPPVESIDTVADRDTDALARADAATSEPSAPDPATETQPPARERRPAIASPVEISPRQQADALAEAAEAEPPRRDAMAYWELPESVRAELPEMRISVQVYADEPAGRFVLMNGRRYTEGDEVGEGLRLEEIRREGSVFRYDIYRFIVER